jgi:hypothetical protein
MVIMETRLVIEIFGSENFNILNIEVGKIHHFKSENLVIKFSDFLLQKIGNNLKSSTFVKNNVT